MALEWQTSYKIGDADVDALQEKLFALTNTFLASDDLTVLRSTIVSLCKQARAQFEREEALMRRVNFPGLEEHLAQHHTLLDRLIGRSMDVGKGYMNKPAIAALMQDWCERHVPEEDARLRQFLAATQSA
ncbi:hemerythrin family protein [Rhodoferax sp.]|uniref:bacteriohemerythrin n=1 Tax=Rhodoferax sp. TaxID=50421 RepID=UPI0025F32664|nr:hemerythrin family protein [Rhodoferax sp.]MCM2296828.1 hemerythrin family protein [Rhodoferax sp.]MDD3936207.1 hemerythrin family protein [Rhodoferax sp.]